MKNEELSKRLVDKSIEAFILGLEIYNKPTIKYRIEGFAFFICNAWELMLKARLINLSQNIYYSDNPERSISLANSIEKIYTDSKQPLRLNLEKIIELRNTSTHFITKDYEAVYAPLFQANVLSFCEQLERFHGKDITKYIAQNFLTLSASIEPLTNEQIKLKYSPEVAQRLIFQKNDIETTSDLYPSNKFAIAIQHNFYQVKYKDKADFTLKIDRNSDQSINTITKYKNPSETHKYSHGNLVKEIQRRLEKQKINFKYETSQGEKKIFNSYNLGIFIKFYDIKNDEKFAFEHVFGKRREWTYSQQLAEFIVSEIKKNPQKIILDLQKANQKR